MSKLRTIYNRLFRKQSDPSQPPVINKVVYSSLEESYCGGTLADMNVLLISRDKDIVSAFKSRYEKENSYVSVVSNTNEITNEDLQNASDEMVGYCDCIVNIIKGNADQDPVKQVYRLFQVESPFLSLENRQATVCTILIVNAREQVEAIKQSYSHLISSLAKLINNHNIVVNAVLTSSYVNMEDVAATSVLMCSKYGEALTGETIVIG